MPIVKIVYPHLGIIDEVEEKIDDSEEEEETTEEEKL